MEVYGDKKGYKRYKKSRKLVHRAIVEKKIGRKLKRRDVVHHINGNKLDNDPTNLEILDCSEHFEIHRNQQWRTGVW